MFHITVIQDSQSRNTSPAAATTISVFSITHSAYFVQFLMSFSALFQSGRPKRPELNLQHLQRGTMVSYSSSPCL